MSEDKDGYRWPHALAAVFNHLITIKMSKSLEERAEKVVADDLNNEEGLRVDENESKEITQHAPKRNLVEILLRVDRKKPFNDGVPQETPKRTGMPGKLHAVITFANRPNVSSRYPGEWTIAVPYEHNEFGANDMNELYDKVTAKFMDPLLRIYFEKKKDEVWISFPDYCISEQEMQQIIYGSSYPFHEQSPLKVVKKTSYLIESRFGFNLAMKDVKPSPDHIIFYLESEWDYITNQYVYANLAELEAYFNTNPNGEPNGKLPSYKIRYVTRDEIVNPPMFFNTIDIDEQPVPRSVGDDDVEQRFIDGENEKRINEYKKINFACINLKYMEMYGKFTEFICYDFEGRMDERERKGRLRIFRDALYKFNYKHRKEDRRES